MDLVHDWLENQKIEEARSGITTTKKPTTTSTTTTTRAPLTTVRVANPTHEHIDRFLVIISLYLSLFCAELDLTNNEIVGEW